MLSPKSVWNGPIPGDLRIVFHRLQQHNIVAFIVGPAVRDALTQDHMDKVARVDFIALAAGIGDIERALDSVTTDTLFWGRPERLRRNTVAFQVKDGGTGELVRRLVISVVADDNGVLEELLKREVTVNAIAMDANGGIIDPYDGARDLAAQRICPVHPAGRAFLQRPLYLVKIAKHIAYHGFPADDKTELHAARNAVNLLDMPMERVRPELERMLLNRHPDLGLDFLQRIGVLGLILPEVQSLVGFNETCAVHHKDIWAHTRQVVMQAKPLPAIRWAALLHDIGKVWTRTIDKDGAVHFLRHEDLSALLFKGIAARLGFDDRLAGRIHYLISNHSRVNMYSGEWTDSAVRRLMRDTGEYLDDLLLLSRADITSRQERRVELLTSLLDELDQRIAQLKEEAAQKPLLPKGAGEIIMNHFGIPPGPVVGRLKKALEEAIAEERVPADLPVEEYLGFLQDLIRSSSN
jgi:poly(A) polymerase